MSACLNNQLAVRLKYSAASSVTKYLVPKLRAPPWTDCASEPRGSRGESVSERRICFEEFAGVWNAKVLLEHQTPIARLGGKYGLPNGRKSEHK